MTLNLPPRDFVSFEEITAERDSLRSSVHELEQTVSSLESERNALNIQNAKLLAACEVAKERLKPIESQMSNGDPIWFCQSCHNYLSKRIFRATETEISDLVHKTGCAFVALDAATKPQGAG